MSSYFVVAKRDIYQQQLMLSNWQIKWNKIIEHIINPSWNNKRSLQTYIRIYERYDVHIYPYIDTQRIKHYLSFIAIFVRCIGNCVKTYWLTIGARNLIEKLDCKAVVSIAAWWIICKTTKNIKLRIQNTLACLLIYTC